MTKESKLKYFPISLFSSVMGFGGFTIALHKMGLESLSLGALVVSLTLLVVISLFYLVKIFKHTDEVKKEFDHPVKHAFFTAFSISLLLMSIAFLSHDKGISYIFWVTGTAFHFLLTLHIVSLWIFHDKFKIESITPAWFIPAVGNVIIPVAGSVHAPAMLSWFFLSYGIFFWVMLQTVVFYRMVFHSPMPEKLLPTVFIMLVPPSLIFISYVKLTGTVDNFAIFMYSIALFIVFFLLYNIIRFIRIPFALPWWAYSFPLAAFTISSMLMYEKTHIFLFSQIAWGVLAVLSILMALLTVKTISAMISGKVFVAE
jgi:tellurite resistance protein